MKAVASVYSSSLTLHFDLPAKYYVPLKIISV